VAPTLTARLLEPGDTTALSLWESRAPEARLLPQDPVIVGALCGEGAQRTVGVFAGETPIAVVPFAVLKGRAVTRWLSPPFLPYCGPLLAANQAGRADERLWRDVLGAVAGEVARHGCPAEILFPPGVDDLRGLVWAGWEARPHYEYVSRWEAPGGWSDQLEATVRRQWRKAASTLAAEVADAGTTGELERLWTETAARQGLDAGFAATLARLGGALEERGAGFSVVVRDANGAAHAAALIGHDATTAYYLAGASGSDPAGSGASTLMQATVLEEIDRRGLARRYDWVGANTPGVAQFKRHFGPALETRFAARLVTKGDRFLGTLRALAGH
jgi:hypothetical protein